MNPVGNLTIPNGEAWQQRWLVGGELRVKRVHEGIVGGGDEAGIRPGMIRRLGDLTPPTRSETCEGTDKHEIGSSRHHAHDRASSLRARVIPWDEDTPMDHARLQSGGGMRPDGALDHLCSERWIVVQSWLLQIDSSWDPRRCGVRGRHLLQPTTILTLDELHVIGRLAEAIECQRSETCTRRCIYDSLGSSTHGCFRHSEQCGTSSRPIIGASTRIDRCQAMLCDQGQTAARGDVSLHD